MDNQNLGVKSHSNQEVAELCVRWTGHTLGHSNGIYLNQLYHISVLPVLSKVNDVLAANYASKLMDDLERDINHASEMLIPDAAEYSTRSLEALNLNAGPNSMTRPGFFTTSEIRRIAAGSLQVHLRSLIQEKLTQAGAYQALHKVETRYERAANAPFPAFDLDSFVLEKTLSVFFQSLHDTEASLKTSPSLWLDEASGTSAN